jgi:hypothetical protein
MKILNIDTFAKVDRQITLGGVTFAVEEPTLQQFIDNLKAAEDLEKSTKAGATVPLSKSFDIAVETIKQSIPTMDEQIIRSLKVPAVTAILQFIRGELDPEVVAGAPAAEGDAVEKKPS